MNPLAYSLVIPCYELPEELDRTLEGIAAQSRLPAAVIVVDASKAGSVREVALRWSQRLPVTYERAAKASAAAQRNQGARLISAAQSEILGFLDDDITLRPETCARICDVFDRDHSRRIGGIAARVEDIFRPAPRGAAWWYYRLQAGYADATYGGRLFGPAINCLPCYTEPAPDDLIASEWLNSGCVFYRTDLFQSELFPDFEGYSFMEDVHLSARIARRQQLFFHASATCLHRDGAPARPREDHRRRARLRRRNQRLVATEVLGRRGLVFELKMLLHRLFVSVAILRSRPAAWREELLGTWL